MFFYSDSIEEMLKKQKLVDRIEDFALSCIKEGKRPAPVPFLVQVVTSQSISDGEYDFPCKFTCQAFRKGSLLRVTRWSVDINLK